MAKQVKKAAVKKKTASPASKVVPSKKPAAKAAKAKPALKKPIPTKTKAPVKKAVPAKKPVSLPAKTEKVIAAKVEPKPVVTAMLPAKDPKKVRPVKPQPVAPPPVDNDVVHIIKKGPPPAEFRAQLAALKRKKGPADKKIFKTEIVNPHIIKDVAQQEKNQKKAEPKGKFVLEFIIHAPVTLLYDFLTTPNGLAEWFADEIDIKDNTYKFNWDGAIQYATILSAKLDNHLRLRWLDKPEGTYFEFRIVPDELLPSEVALLVTDFGESEDDIRTSRQLWEAQIHRLMKSLGSY